MLDNTLCFLYILTVQPKPPDPLEQQAGLAASSSSPGSEYGNGTQHVPYSIIVSTSLSV